MNNLKICLFLSVLLLTACSASNVSSQASTSIDNGNSTSDVADVQSEHSGELSLVTSYLGPDSEASTEDGFYQAIPNPQGGTNIMYTDYATQSTLYLCPDPNCLHNSDSCSSWFDSSSVQLFSVPSQMSLYAIVSSSDKSDLIKLSLDGLQRTTLYTCTGRESFQDAIVADESNIYIALSSVNSNTAIPTKQLIQLNVSTGNCKVLLDYEAQDWLFGAYSDNLLIFYFENDSFTYRSYSLSEGTLTDIYSYDYQDGSPNTIARPVDNFLYIFEPQESGSAKVICLNMETKSTADLNLSVPYFGTDATTIGSPFDDYLYVTTHDFNSSSTVSYLINRITGEYSPITLSYMQGAISVGVEVIASTSEYYLVNTGITPVPIMLTSNDGSQYQSEIDMVSYSLIKKDDYLSNTPAYIPITNQFTA